MFLLGAYLVTNPRAMTKFKHYCATASSETVYAAVGWNANCVIIARLSLTRLTNWEAKSHRPGVMYFLCILGLHLLLWVTTRDPANAHNHVCA